MQASDPSGASFLGGIRLLGSGSLLQHDCVTHTPRQEAAALPSAALTPATYPGTGRRSDRQWPEKPWGEPADQMLSRQILPV